MTTPPTPHTPSTPSGPARSQAPSVREIAALTARLRQLSARGADADPVERAAFLADKDALIDRITAATPASAPPVEVPAPAREAGPWWDGDGWFSSGADAAHTAHLDALAHVEDHSPGHRSGAHSAADQLIDARLRAARAGSRVTLSLPTSGPVREAGSWGEGPSDGAQDLDEVGGTALGDGDHIDNLIDQHTPGRPAEDAGAAAAEAAGAATGGADDIGWRPAPAPAPAPAHSGTGITAAAEQDTESIISGGIMGKHEQMTPAAAVARLAELGHDRAEAQRLIGSYLEEATARHGVPAGGWIVDGYDLDEVRSAAYPSEAVVRSRVNARFLMDGDRIEHEGRVHVVDDAPLVHDGVLTVPTRAGDDATWLDLPEGEWVTLQDRTDQTEGRNEHAEAYWCPPSAPCHADALLDLANLNTSPCAGVSGDTTGSPDRLVGPGEQSPALPAPAALTARPAVPAMSSDVEDERRDQLIRWHTDDHTRARADGDGRDDAPVRALDDFAPTGATTLQEW